MSLDSIVRITISTQNLAMAQAGFGTPIIIAQHDYLKQRVQSFSNLAELFSIRDTEKEKALPEDKQFHKHPLYLMASTLFSQNPSVPKVKIGKRLANESVTEALNNIINSDADGDFYGVLLLPNDAKKDYVELAQSIGSKRLLAGIDIDDTTMDIAANIAKSDGARRIFTIFKEEPSDYPAAAWMGRMLTQAPGSTSWAFKELMGIKKSKLSSDKISKLKEAVINRHIDINKVGVTMDGKVMSKEYIDIVHGIDWLHVRIQERLFRLLMINEKIPYTLKGIDLVRSEIMAQLKDAVYRGLLAPEPEPHVSTPAIEDIDPLVRGQRKLPDVCFSGRLAGAIHEIEIRGTVTT
ncbi:DUF3383 family protein [Candidatus Dojkabacteria bacterium]|uniref:DUF3383 family protein n=1 Tax=Candidatus Dojkabacteria bacterium TaxID=2099670 RepID=A0A5C7J326_9BACT|nr:MAG: DUF3383 family protein [Candidatus Dojkabacteria bacterium]